MSIGKTDNEPKFELEMISEVNASENSFEVIILT